MADRWRQIEELFHRALEREEPVRSAFLEEACAGNEALRREVESLLAEESGSGFMETPAMEGEARELAQGHRPGLEGRRIGTFEILAPLGRGGMGEVWRARDTKLRREVAVKTLPEEFAKDQERLARFEREATLLAALNHPNIATIYGLEEDRDTRFLVLELVEGDTLADRLKRGPIPVEESLRLALQIAEALESAHQKGVIHRDLKPANIKVTPEGNVKVLDFGLAKAFVGDGVAVDPSESPTISMTATKQGVIQGTAAYMSPEQARGREVDRRADIWAFGCVLYEALAGRRAFQGNDVPEILAALLRAEPEWDRLPANLHPRLREVLERCLEKDLRRRRHDIADVRVDLEKIQSDSGGLRTATEQPIARWKRSTGLALGGMAAGLTLLLLGNFLSPSPTVEVTRLTLDVHEGAHLGFAADDPLTFGRPVASTFALSPDGRSLVYVGNDGADGRQLYLRSLGQDQVRPIPGTEGAGVARFSPDGQSIGFFHTSGRNSYLQTSRELMRVPVNGGEVRTVSTTGLEFLRDDFIWTDDDRILLSSYEGVLQVPANGGVVTNLTTHDRGPGYVQAYPQLLPGGRAVLYAEGPLYRGVPSEEFNVIVESLETRDRIVVVEGGTDPAYLESGHIAFVHSGTLMAVPFDAANLVVTGDPVVVVEDVMQAEGGINTVVNVGIGQYSVSRSGTLAYLPGGIMPVGQSQLNWVDLAGNAEPVPLPPAGYAFPRFSPDGTRLAYVEGRLGETRSIWVYDMGLGVAVPLPKPSLEHENFFFAWSPDGTEIVFSSLIGDSPRNLYLTAADGSGQPQRLTESDVSQSPGAWSPNGVLAFVEQRAAPDIMILSMDGDSEPAPFRETPFSDTHLAFSPDGNWLAYTSNETGRLEVHVRPFPAGEPAYQVSNGGGVSPAWSPNGEQLFYRYYVDAEVGRFMVADVNLGPTFTRSRPRMLFEGRHGWATPLRNYDVSPDGDRFVMPTRVEREGELARRIHIVLNWFEELKELAPVP